MSRPRLVQEGVPLYGPGSEVDPYQQESKNDDFEMEITGSSAAESAPQKMSSLQRAAASSSSKNHRSNSSKSSYSKKKTSYTIGGPSSVTAATAPATSSYSHDSYNMQSRHDQSSAPMTDTYTQQSHSYSYTVGTAQHEQYAPSHAVTHHATIGNDHMMEDENMSSYNLANHGYNHDHSNYHYQHQQPIPHPNPGPIFPVTTTHPIPGPIPPVATTPTTYVVGGGDSAVSQAQHASVEKMEGVQDHGSKMPLVVLDGANVAHYYADALAAMKATFTEKSHRRGKPEPDAKGIQVATDYFLSVGVRVLVVLPQYWMRKKPRSGDNSDANAMMETSQFDILKNLDDKGLIVASPPRDDDDAYALTIAKREELRAVRQRNGEGPGFVLSNDMFRDAQERDPTGVLKEWLNQGRNETIGPGRISYAFCDMGTMDDHGDRILDFVPNPRHPFVMYVEGLHHQAIMNR